MCFPSSSPLFPLAFNNKIIRYLLSDNVLWKILHAQLLILPKALQVEHWFTHSYLPSTEFKAQECLTTKLAFFPVYHVPSNFTLKVYNYITTLISVDWYPPCCANFSHSHAFLPTREDANTFLKAMPVMDFNENLNMEWYKEPLQIN